MSLSSMGLLCRVAMFAVLSHVYGPQLVKLCGGKADIDFDQPDSWAGRQRIRGTIYAGDTFIVINSKLLVFYSCHLLVGFNCFCCYYCCFCYCFLSSCTCLPSPQLWWLQCTNCTVFSLLLPSTLGLHQPCSQHVSFFANITSKKF